MTSYAAAPGFARPRRGHGARLAWVMAMNEGRGPGHEHGPHDGPQDGPQDGPGRGAGRGRGRFGGPGFGPGFGGPGFGPRGPRGGGRRGGRGGRGDVRAAILLLLLDQPLHGYQLIQQIVERSGGVWTPSPGSVYPALQQLEDEGLVAFERVDGRKTASLTDAGREHVQTHRAELGSPWDDVGGGVTTEVRDLRDLVGTLMQAVHQVAHVGTREQAAQAAQVLTAARTSLYRILAGDDTTS